MEEEICWPFSEKYKIKRVLGKGGGGHVYLALDELGRQVALKHRKALTPDDQAQVERLLQEARTVASLRHPNVAIVYTTVSYPESGDYCVVMEYANGGSVADLLKAEGRLSIERALDIGIEVCTALEYVHRQGLVHGDIKPSNILLFQTDGGTETKIADFGLSRGAQVGDHQPEGQEGTFSGTLEYAAPELLGGAQVDRRADLYSLGVVLYKMLIREPPFPFRGDLAAVIAGHLHGDVTPPQELRPAVFDELSELILKALAKSPSERFQDAEAILAGLQKTEELCKHYHEQAQELYNQGIRFEEQRKWSEAVKSLEEACTLNPEVKDVEQRLKNAQLQLELETAWRETERLLAEKTWADALEQLGRIGTLDPMYRAEEVNEKTKYARLQLDLASLYGDAREAEGAGRRREAMRLYVKIVVQDDGYRDATHRLARLREEEDLENLRTQGERLIENQEWEEAIRVYEQMLGMDADHTEAAQRLVYAQQKLELARLYAQALAELEKENWDKAIKALQDITKREPGYKDAAVRLAKASRRQQLTQLRHSIKRALEAHQWSEAGRLLDELLHLEPGDREVQQQRKHVQQWQKFEDMYRRGKHNVATHQWNEAITRLEGASKIAEAASLDLQDYRDIRLLLDQAKTHQKLDALREEGKQHEAAGDFDALTQVLDRMLELDPGNQEALEWKEVTSQQIQLRNLYNEASSTMEQRDWDTAKRLLDEIASIDAEYRDVRDKRTQVAINQSVNLARRWGFPLAIVVGVIVLVLFVPGLVMEARPQLGLGSLAVTPEFVGIVFSAFALLVSIMGLLVPAEKLYGLLEKDKRVRVCAILAVLLVTACLLMLMLMALVAEPPATKTPTPEPETLCNGNFEDDFACWQHGGELDQTVECDETGCYAVLGNPDYPCYGGVPVGEAWIKQSFEVPQGISLTLSLKYRVFSYDISLHDLGLPGYDYFQMAINGEPRQRDGNTVWNEASCDREPWDSDWQNLTLDLSAYQGQEVEISFHNVNGIDDPDYNTWTYVANVRIDEIN